MIHGTSRWRWAILAALCVFLGGLASPGGYSADKAKRTWTLAPPVFMVRDVPDQEAKDSEPPTIALGVNIRSRGLVIVTGSSARQGNQPQVTVSGQPVAPSAIVALPATGLAGLALDAKEDLPVAREQPVVVGQSVMIVHAGGAYEPLFTRGIVSRVVPAERGSEFSVDVAIGPGVKEGIVLDMESQCIGVVATDKRAGVARCLSIAAAEHGFRRWREAAADSKEKPPGR